MKIYTFRLPYKNELLGTLDLNWNTPKTYADFDILNKGKIFLCFRYLKNYQ